MELIHMEGTYYISSVHGALCEKSQLNGVELSLVFLSMRYTIMIYMLDNTHPHTDDSCRGSHIIPRAC